MRAGKVPNLVNLWHFIQQNILTHTQIYFYIYINRIPTEKVKQPSLNPLQSSNCHHPDITIKTPTSHSRSRTVNGTLQASNGKEYSPGKLAFIVQGTDCLVVNGKEMNEKTEEGKISNGYGSKFSCQWIRVTVDDGQTHKEPRDEHNEEDSKKENGGSKPKDEDNTELKLYNIANELLQTERAYVARLHLLDRVSDGLHVSSIL